MTSSVLSIDDVSNNSLNIYPNPASDFINLPSSLIGESYIIYDVLGKQVNEGVINSTVLQLSNISNGVYYLKVPSYKTVKFIKK